MQATQAIVLNPQPQVAMLAFGANRPSEVGDPAATVRAAMAAVSLLSAGGARTSRLYRTPAFPPGSGPDFVNAAVALDCSGMQPRTLLQECHAIEAHFGRQRRARWEARVLDIDLIAFGAQVLPDVDTLRHWIDLPLAAQKTQAPGELILPHPRLQDRAFVLRPLADVAPEWRHPVLDLTVQQMLAALPQQELAAITQI